MKAEMICIVDDDEIFQLTVAKILERIDSEKKILSFFDGEQAYNFFSNNKDNSAVLPDIIFLDINMPFMDGWQFLDEYAKIKPLITKQILIYMVSSSISDCDIQKAKSIDLIQDYLVKPVSIDTYKTLVSMAS